MWFLSYQSQKKRNKKKKNSDVRVWVGTSQIMPFLEGFSGEKVVILSRYFVLSFEFQALRMGRGALNVFLGIKDPSRWYDEFIRLCDSNYVRWGPPTFNSELLGMELYFELEHNSIWLWSDHSSTVGLKHVDEWTYKVVKIQVHDSTKRRDYFIRMVFGLNLIQILRRAFSFTIKYIRVR